VNGAGLQLSAAAAAAAAVDFFFGARDKKKARLGFPFIAPSPS
jgi:hypothetical protein